MARLWLSYAGYLEFTTAYFPGLFLVFAIVFVAIFHKKVGKKILNN